MKFFATIGNLIPGLFGVKLSFQTAKIAGIAILVLLAGAAIKLAIYAHDQSVINQHESDRRAEKAEKELEAQRKTDEELANTTAELEQTQQELDKATEEAARNDPEGAAGSVGPVSQSYYDTIKKKGSKP